MTYFMTPSALAYALLVLGLIVTAASVAVTVQSATYSTGSPATVAENRVVRATAAAGAVLIILGSTPLLWAPVQSLLAGTGI